MDRYYEIKISDTQIKKIPINRLENFIISLKKGIKKIIRYNHYLNKSEIHWIVIQETNSSIITSMMDYKKLIKMPILFLN